MSTQQPEGQVILLHPDLRRLGGIETYAIKLKRYLHTPVISMTLAKRPHESGSLKLIGRLMGDYQEYRRVLKKCKVGVVHANPSLDPKGFLREGIYVRQAGKAGFKTIVFFHGWSEAVAGRIDKAPALFRSLYGNVDMFIVLAKAFEERLRQWGVTQPVHREVTTVDDASLAGFDLEACLAARGSRPIKQILFAGRIMKEKGILQLLLALEVLTHRGLSVELVVLGDGPDLEEAKALAVSKHLTNVVFHGRVEHDSMTEHYRNASFFCFPSSHPEGLPSVLVEAMAHGVPVIASPAGGIGDVIQSPRNGILLENNDPVTIADALESMIENPEICESVARRNYQYGQDVFLASQSAKRMDLLYQELLSS